MHRRAFFSRAVLLSLALPIAACGGNSGTLVADSGPHSAITTGGGYVLWIRNTDLDNTPGAVNRLAIGATVADTLVREGALWSQYYDSLWQSLTVSGSNAYFTTSSRVVSVPLATPEAFTTLVDNRQHGTPTLLAADADHVYWTVWSGAMSQNLMSQSLVDGTQTKLASTSVSSGNSVRSDSGNSVRSKKLRTGRNGGEA